MLQMVQFECPRHWNPCVSSSLCEFPFLIFCLPLSGVIRIGILGLLLEAWQKGCKWSSLNAPGTETSESPKQDFLVSAEYEPSVTKNYRIFGRNQIFGNCIFVAKYSVIYQIFDPLADIWLSWESMSVQIFCNFAEYSVILLNIW